MSMNTDGYAYYVEKCKQYGLEPVNYRTFISNLTPEQLRLFNTHMETKESA